MKSWVQIGVAVGRLATAGVTLGNKTRARETGEASMYIIFLSLSVKVNQVTNIHTHSSHVGVYNVLLNVKMDFDTTADTPIKSHIQNLIRR